MPTTPHRELRILAITRKPTAGSFLQRIAENVEPLAAHGITVACRVLPKDQRGQRRLIGEARRYDGVWWQRHQLSPWWLPRLRRCARRIVFDFDDPISFSSRGGGSPSLTRRLGFASMLRTADAAICASAYLASLARPHCRAVHVVPMPVTLPEELVAQSPDHVEVLWFGSRVTQAYLETIRPALERFGDTRPGALLRVVSDDPFELDRLTVDRRAWSPEQEQAALRECHIGLCPMPDTPWTRGKCPYKVLLYMAHGMPWVGSPVGENRVTAGSDDDPRGLLAATPDAWVERLTTLLDDVALRSRLGERGRVYVEQHHDRSVLVEQLATIWRDIVGS